MSPAFSLLVTSQSWHFDHHASTAVFISDHFIIIIIIIITRNKTTDRTLSYYVILLVSYMLVSCMLVSSAWEQFHVIWISSSLLWSSREIKQRTVLCHTVSYYLCHACLCHLPRSSIMWSEFNHHHHYASINTGPRLLYFSHVSNILSYQLCHICVIFLLCPLSWFSISCLFQTMRQQISILQQFCVCNLFGRYFASPFP